MSVSIAELTFGAEFEVIMPRTNNNQTGRNALARYLTDNGVETRHEPYNHSRRTWWKIVTDASLGYDNAEIVSPILQGEAGLDQVRRLCRLIDDFGCRVNRSCGHHIHVGVRDRFGQQIGFFKELLKTYGKFQPVIDALVAPSRRGRTTYCVPVRYTDEMDRATTLDQLARLAGAGHFTNPNFWDAYSRHGTVEFRQHQGTINGEKSVKWITFCLRMVAHAAKNTEASSASPSVRPPGRWTEEVAEVRDLTQAPVVPAAELTRANFSRWRGGATQRIVYVAPTNPRRAGTRGAENWDVYRQGETVRQLIQRVGYGVLTHLRYDVDRGYVRIVNESTAPVITPRVPSRYVEDPVMPTLDDAPAVERPATDAAPATLEGLMELIGAAADERSYFQERAMELNP